MLIISKCKPKRKGTNRIVSPFFCHLYSNIPPKFTSVNSVSVFHKFEAWSANSKQIFSNWREFMVHMVSKFLRDHSIFAFCFELLNHHGP